MIMSTRHPIPFRIRSFAMLLMLSASSLFAAEGDAVQLVPGAVAPGGQYRITAQGLSVSTRCQLAPTVGIRNIAFTTDASGNYAGVADVAVDAAPESMEFVLTCSDQPGVQLGRVWRHIVAPPTLLFEPQRGRVGEPVGFMASGLVGTSLQLEAGDHTLFGPQSFTGEEFDGQFVMRRDVVGPFAGTEVRMTLRAGDLVAARLRVQLAVDQEAVLPLTLAESQLTPVARPDEPIVFSGRLAVTAEQSQRMSVTTFWKDASGMLAPLTPPNQPVASDGRFSGQGWVPSVRTLHGVVARQAGQVVHVVSESDPVSGRLRTQRYEAGGVGTAELIDFGPGGHVRLRLLGPGGQPLEGALVDIQARQAGGDVFIDPQGTPPGGAYGMSAVIGQVNQIQFLHNGILANSQTVGCPLSLTRGKTDANGEFAFRLDREQAEQALAFSAGLCSGNVNSGDALTCAGSDGRYGMRIAMYTAHLGYGELNDNDFAPPRVVDIAYVPNEDRFYGPDGQTLSAPGTGLVRSYSFAPLAEPRLQPILVKRSATGTPLTQWNLTDGVVYPQYPTETVNGATRYNLGRIFGAPPAFGIEFRGDPRFPVELVHDSVVFGELQSAELHLCPDTICADGPQFSANLELLNAVLFCGVVDLALYSATLPRSVIERLGAQKGLVRVRSLRNGQLITGDAPFVLRLDPPPEWLRDQSLLERSIDLFPNGVSGLHARQRLNGNGPSSVTANHSSWSEYNLAPQRSESDNIRTVTVYQRNAVEPPSFLSDKTVSSNEVSNKGGPAKEHGGSAALRFGLQNNSCSSANILECAKDRRVLFETGNIPLFRFSWGLDPIAAATLGADLWFRSTLAFYGELQPPLEPSQGPLLTAYTEPQMEGGIELFFRLSAIMGLVSADARAIPSMGLALTTPFVDGVLQTQQIDKCFHFKMDVAWEACLLFCAGGTEPLFAVAEPDTAACRSNANGAAKRINKLIDYRPSSASALAIGSSGTGMLMRRDSAGRFVVNGLNYGQVMGATQLSPRADGVGSSAAGVIGVASGVMIWSEATGGTDLNSAARNQHLRWARWNGSSSNSPQNLTAPGSGDGDVALAVCGANVAQCPSGGEATAVWVRQVGAAFKDHHYAVMYSRYSPNTGWTAPTRLDPAAGSASDLQPAVVYLGGNPIVFWVRKPDSGLDNLQNRQIAYRLLDGGSPVRIATDLPAGVAWPSLSVRRVTSGIYTIRQLVLAYTVAQDQGGFIGNRQAVNMAYATCGGGTCNFTNQEIRDSFGRQLRGESPRIFGTSDGSGNVTLAMRALGFGPDANGVAGRPNDPIGVLQGQGELISVITRLDGRRVNLNPLTLDAGYHAVASFAMDPTQGRLLAVSQPFLGLGNGLNEAESQRELAKRGVRSKLIDEGLVMISAPQGVDLALGEIQPSTSFVSGGTNLAVQVEVRNLGSAFVGASGHAGSVVAAWNGPEGLGETVFAEPLQDYPINSRRLLTLSIPVPDGFREDEEHSLHVWLQLEPSAQEANIENNQSVVLVGAMPIPVGLSVSQEPEQSMLYLSWTLDDPADPRVAGYRVSLVREDGTRIALGSSPVLGFADPAVRFGETRRYVVSSYSANGIESAESEMVLGVARLNEALFSDAFEAEAFDAVP